jgi:hypothetical protein
MSISISDSDADSAGDDDEGDHTVTITEGGSEVSANSIRGGGVASGDFLLDGTLDTSDNAASSQRCKHLPRRAQSVCGGTLQMYSRERNVTVLQARHTC